MNRDPLGCSSSWKYFHGDGIVTNLPPNREAIHADIAIVVDTRIDTRTLFVFLGLGGCKGRFVLHGGWFVVVGGIRGCRRRLAFDVWRSFVAAINRCGTAK